MWRPYSFLEVQDNKLPITFEGRVITEGEHIVFQLDSLGFPHYGTIVSIDLVATHPLKIEWYSWHDVKRISRFTPDEITSLIPQETLNHAKERANSARRAYAKQDFRAVTSS